MAAFPRSDIDERQNVIARCQSAGLVAAGDCAGMADVEIDETELEQWTGAVDTVLDRLRDFFLPDDFPFDFTPESLAPLEAVLLDRSEPRGDFLESALAYVGQVALELTGGTWAVGRHPAEVPDDAP